MVRLKEIGHVLLRVLDLERSRRFYTEVLGFQVLEEDPEHGRHDRDAPLVLDR
jgi:catechol 2,3-dioxygenase-like lactoylglutathione lyase family enzyme